MSYNYKNAIDATFEYLNVKKEDVTFIEETNNRGFVLKVNNENIVIYIAPIGCKKNNAQNWIDTRDSGVKERRITYKYAKSKNYKYFFLCVNSEQERFKNFFLSLENTEQKISEISFRKKENSIGTGTQANIPNNFIPSKNFERIHTDKGFWISAIKKECIMDYFTFFDNRPYDAVDDNSSVLYIDDPDGKSVEETDNVIFSDEVGYNKIYYGIPGCGKSYYIENTVLRDVDKDNDVFRTTFYLDYSNSDFIGQIYPVVKDNGSVSYEEKPGPFTKALASAFKNSDKMIYLVIEEINRGNAAAIFGDTFQLLDRLKEDRDGRVAGDSEYPVNNEFIEVYFKKNNIPFNSDKIYIPHNLTLLATMNTSDQNVFPLDTAFKRRWDREKVMTDWNKVGDIKNLYVPFTNITWGKFATTINNKMLEDNGESDVSVSEDKQMGAYFVKENMLSKEKNTGDKDSLRAFISNVMDYLYNDVTKFNHELLFDKNVKTYDGLYETMTECKSVIDKEVDDSSVGAGKELFESVFKKEIVNELLGQEVDNEQGTNN